LYPAAVAPGCIPISGFLFIVVLLIVAPAREGVNRFIQKLE